jgi:hypothetical protein
VAALGERDGGVTGPATDDPLDAVAWPVRTERLLLQRAEASDAAATWAYRQLPEVSHWITQAPAPREEYEEYFCQGERLAKTLVVERDGGVGGGVVGSGGDLMLMVEDAWAQAEVRLS